MTMILLTLLLLLPSSKCLQIKMSCHRYIIGDKLYSKETLWSYNIGSPYHLHVHKTTNTLIAFIIHIFSVDFQLAYYDLDTKDYSFIAGIVDGCSVAIDQKNDDIYLGGSDGIYKFNMVTKIADYYKEKGKNIWGMFYRRNLFYISYPDQKLYMEIDDKFVKIREFENIEIYYFHITHQNVIIYANQTGLYRYDNENKSTEVINEYVTVKQISEDIDGNVYVCCNIGLFIYKDNVLVQILNMRNLQGIAFDRDNRFIISDKNQIFKLIESNVSCLAVDTW